MDLWLSDSPFNTQKYSSERYDELVGGAQTETDFGKRMDMLLEAEKVLVEEDAACAPMFYEGQVRLVDPSIKNFVYYRSGGYAMKLWKV
jgi:ABC-type oligopeptide transport system substrate-binding subunit